jgi:hypothetical protein
VTAARVIQLDAYRHPEPVPAPAPVPAPDVRTAVAREASRRPGLAYRLTHSAAARDLRANAFPAGLLLAVVLVAVWGSAWGRWL